MTVDGTEFGEPIYLSACIEWQFSDTQPDFARCTPLVLLRRADCAAERPGDLHPVLALAPHLAQLALTWFGLYKNINSNFSERLYGESDQTRRKPVQFPE